MDEIILTPDEDAEFRSCVKQWIALGFEQLTGEERCMVSIYDWSDTMLGDTNRPTRHIADDTQT